MFASFIKLGPEILEALSIYAQTGRCKAGSTQGPRVSPRILHTRGQALSPSWLHQLGVAGDGFAEAAQVANLFEEVEAVIVDNAALSQGDTTTRAPHMRHTHSSWHKKAELDHLLGTELEICLFRPWVLQ